MAWLGSPRTARIYRAQNSRDLDTKKTPILRVHTFTALLLRRKYLLWRCALACERLRCEPWRPWGWGGTTRGLRRPARRGVGH